MITALLLGSLIISGCGGKSSRLSTTPITTGNIPSGSSGDAGGSVGQAATPYPFSVLGHGDWVSDEIRTDNLLKIRIVPGPAGVNNNFTANYGCLQVTVRIDGMASGAITKIMSVNGGSQSCPGAPAEDSVDLSGFLTVGHGPVKVAVDTVLTDFYCLDCSFNPARYGYNCRYYCPVRNQFDTHVATGTLFIQTNGLGSP